MDSPRVHSRKLRAWSAVGLFTCIAAVISPQPSWSQTGSVIHVNDNASGLNNGSSWEDAYTDVKAAVAAASAGDRVWVARGTYSMGSGTLTLKLGVEIYGGFDGDETTLEDRDPDPETNGTLINGGPGYARHVVTAPAGTDGSAVFDGFTVAAGHAEGAASKVENHTGDAEFGFGQVGWATYGAECGTTPADSCGGMGLGIATSRRNEVLMSQSSQVNPGVR